MDFNEVRKELREIEELEKERFDKEKLEIERFDKELREVRKELRRMFINDTIAIIGAGLLFILLPYMYI